MIDTIGEWLAALLEWADMIPIQGYAILFGILLGGIVTQWLKRTIPLAVLFPTKSKQFHVTFIRVLALVCAFVPTYILWPDDQFELWAALAVGFATPSIYRMITTFVYKKWPHLEARWSGTE